MKSYFVTALTFYNTTNSVIRFDGMKQLQLKPKNVVYMKLL